MELWSRLSSDWLEWRVGYRESSLPNLHDDTITALVRAYRGAAGRDRKACQDAVQETTWTPLLIYAERMASLAVKLKDVDRVLDGLLAIALQGRTRERYDSLFSAAVLYHSAGRLGQDAQLLFDAAAALAPPSSAHVLLTFTRERSPDNRTLHAFGYHEVDDPTYALSYELD